MIAPVLYLIRRWLPPFGAVTVLFSSVAVFMSSLVGFREAWSIVPAVVAGLAADLTGLLLAQMMLPVRPRSQT